MRIISAVDATLLAFLVDLSPVECQAALDRKLKEYPEPLANTNENRRSVLGRSVPTVDGIEACKTLIKIKQGEAVPNDWRSEAAQSVMRWKEGNQRASRRD